MHSDGGRWTWHRREHLDLPLELADATRDRGMTRHPHALASTYGQVDPHPETPVLTIYNGGRAGAEYPTDLAHGTAPPRIIDTALRNFARCVEGIPDAYNGIGYIDAGVHHPWARGSYAGFAPGQYTDFWGFLGTTEGNVLFAGEHTSTFAQGYLEGGVESGERAAQEVINRLGVAVAA